ncbi:hypothetical protein [Reyranella sp.]|uniref:hypothetical protein n=1 Tax=Reyranella sp. TaxID=1929291 RepID=UPI003D13ECD6
MAYRARAFGVAIGVALGLAFSLSVHPSIAKPEAAASRPGPIIIVYRDDVSNVRQLKGVAHYGGLLGRDPSVSFTVVNESGEQVCSGTFTTEARRSGKFSLSCFKGYFSGNGNYERKAGDRGNSFIARGQTARGLPLMLVVGRPSGIADGQFLSP